MFQRILTETEVRTLLKHMCESGAPAVIDWTNRNISVLSKEKTDSTRILSSTGQPLVYRDVIFRIS